MTALILTKSNGVLANNYSLVYFLWRRTVSRKKKMQKKNKKNIGKKKKRKKKFPMAINLTGSREILNYSGQAKGLHNEGATLL